MASGPSLKPIPFFPCILMVVSSIKTWPVSLAEFYRKATMEHIEQATGQLRELLVGLPEARLVHVLPVLYSGKTPAKSNTIAIVKGRTRRVNYSELLIFNQLIYRVELEEIEGNRSRIGLSRSHGTVFWECSRPL